MFSVVSWAIFLSKNSILKKAEKESEAFYKNFKNSGDLDIAYKDAKNYDLGFLPSIYVAGYDELNSLCKLKLEASTDSMTNIQRAMIAKKTILLKKLGKKVSFLATVGSSSPFIGLLGTVWGIMNSFRGLSVSHNNTLSAVAPGIAEALIATAIGLFAAIPAVIFYNHINNRLDKIEQNIDAFTYEFINMAYKIFVQPENNGKGDKNLDGTRKGV